MCTEVKLIRFGLVRVHAGSNTATLIFPDGLNIPTMVCSDVARVSWTTCVEVYHGLTIHGHLIGRGPVRWSVSYFVIFPDCG